MTALRSHLLVTCCVIVHAAVGTPALAAEPENGLSLRVRPLFDGLVRENEWTALDLTVANVGEATFVRAAIVEPSLTGEADPLTYLRRVELPKGTRHVLLPYKPSIILGLRTLTLVTDDDRAVEAPYKLQAIGQGDVAIGIVGAETFGLPAIRDTWAYGVPGKRPRPEATGPRQVRVGQVLVNELPDRQAAYGALDWLVWPRPDPTELEPAQMDALRDWVADGGHLLVTVTDSWPTVAKSGLADLLPVELNGLTDTTSLGSLLEAVGARTMPTSLVIPIATAGLREIPGREKWIWASTEDSSPLWVTGTYGLGTVHVVLSDIGTAPLSQVNRNQLWRRLLWLPAAEEPWAGTALPDWPPMRHFDYTRRDAFASAMDNSVSALGGALDLSEDEWGPLSQWRSSLRGVLNDIHGVAPLPLSWLLLFSVAYLIVIGPLDYALLRFFRRQPLTWLTFPLYIAAFSGIALAATSARKGSRAVVQRVELIDGLPGTTLWRGDTYLGVFSARKSDVSLRSAGVAEPLTPERGAMWSPIVEADEGPGRVNWHAETWTLAYTRSRWVDEAKGTVSVETTGARAHVKSTLPFDLQMTELCVTSQCYRLGPLPAGTSRDVDLGTPSSVSEGAWLSVGDELPEAGSEERITWIESRFLARPPEGRGHFDTSSTAVVLAFTEMPVEQLDLDGIEPDAQVLSVLRIPVNPSAF